MEVAALSVRATSGHLKSGAMRGLVASSKSHAFPEIPTLAELGYRQNLPGIWFAFYAPAGVPAEVTTEASTARFSSIHGELDIPRGDLRPETRAHAKLRVVGSVVL